MGPMTRISLAYRAGGMILSALLFLLHPGPGARLAAEEPGGPLLKDVVAGFDQYKGKKLTLRMKLKYYDSTFEKIVFYDARQNQNLDIEFDVSTKEKKKLLRADMEVLHEGVDYYVTFIAEELNSRGLVTGSLQGFSPAFLENLPEKRRARQEKPKEK